MPDSSAKIKQVKKKLWGDLEKNKDFLPNQM
jgi:hypothetical protein